MGGRRGRRMITLLGYLMMLPFYILMLSIKIMWKLFKVLIWTIVIIMGIFF